MSKDSDNRKEWFQVVEDITPFMVRVVTRNGHGTGFLLATSATGQICGVATAYHVIAEAFEWGFPIRLEHVASNKMRLLNSEHRYIEVTPGGDTAVILFEKQDFPLPQMDLVLVPETRFQKVGCEVGWLGFPAMAPKDLCFFSGAISNRNQNAHSYLVDGVAINGVSGGPVFHRSAGGVQLVGIISSYIPNVSTGTPMPGLAVVRDVSPFFNTIKKLKELPSQEKQQEQQEKQAENKAAPLAEPPKQS